MMRLKRLVASARPAFRSESNVRYGPHRSHSLDVHYPRATSGRTAKDADGAADAAALEGSAGEGSAGEGRVVEAKSERRMGAPVLVFLHGGGFRGGQPSANAYQGKAALEHGAVYVSMGYRLIPDARFPDSVDDVELGLRWVCEHIPERGGDPSRIFLSGHSAGAMLAAWTALRASDVNLAGVVLISGFYDLTHEKDEIMNRQSPHYVPHLAEAIERFPPYVSLVVGEHDFPNALPDSQAVLQALESRGANVEFHLERGADHYTANRGFYSSDGAVFQSLRRAMGLPATTA
jgi:arylformamidase